MVFVVLEPANQEISTPLYANLDVFCYRLVLTHLLFDFKLGCHELGLELMNEFGEDVGLHGTMIMIFSNYEYILTN